MKKNDHKAYVHSKDNGPDVPVEKQKKIFERFEIASNDGSVTGLGLGL